MDAIGIAIEIDREVGAPAAELLRAGITTSVAFASAVPCAGADSSHARVISFGEWRRC
jgi:hypothetical protein